MNKATERIKEAKANNEFYVPEEYEQKKIIANTPLWLREYFRYIGIEEGKQIMKTNKNIFCNKHQVYHRVFPKYASCIMDKTMIREISTMNKSNHTIGCDLEAYAQTLRFRSNEKEADELYKIASRLK